METVKTNFKIPALQNPKHRGFVPTLPCMVCGHDVSNTRRDGHHLNCMRRDDSKIVPLCRTCHTGDKGVHSTGHQDKWFEERGIINQHIIAARIFLSSGDYEYCYNLITRRIAA